MGSESVRGGGESGSSGSGGGESGSGGSPVTETDVFVHLFLSSLLVLQCHLSHQFLQSVNVSFGPKQINMKC